MFLLVNEIIAQMAKLVNARDLKSLGYYPCGFDSHFGHGDDFKGGRNNLTLAVFSAILF